MGEITQIDNDTAETERTSVENIATAQKFAIVMYNDIVSKMN